MLANDLSPAAVQAMKRNVELNDLGEKVEPPSVEGSEKLGNGDTEKMEVVPRKRPAKVRINEGDAW